MLGDLGCCYSFEYYIVIYKYGITHEDDGSGLFQAANAHCHRAEMVDEVFEEHKNMLKMLTRASNFQPIKCLWDVLD